ncbi:MAG: glycoside hydrolase family 5 protein [Oscillospiraceae bacterium]|nr:glycoside hydrolase family 5 protein [Oscillospiraceae bacterium]
MKKRSLSAVTALVMAVTMLAGCGGEDPSETVGETSDVSQTAAQTESPEETAPPEEAPVIDDGQEDSIRNMTSIDMIRAMGNGINLGNTLEAYNHNGYRGGANPDGFETGWGQPYTTAEMIQGMKDAGFDTIRIPVAWTNGMNYEDGDYTIDERLMDRVETVVNYALDADMYVIVNDHWDGGWWGLFGSAEQADRDKALEMYKSMWSQIGENFKDYSYKLIFESANEELGDRLNDKDVSGSEGVLSKNECYETANMINSEFVKLIRSQGGKNEDRFLLIAGYNTDIAMTCDERFKMPEDTAVSKLLLSVHYYTPWDYCATESVDHWGSPTDYDEQNGLFEKLSKFSEQGYGVVIGEYAVMKNNGGIKPDTDKFYSNLLDNCDLYDYCPVLWDCSNFYKRVSNTTADETLAEIFSSRRYENEKDRSVDDIKSAAKESIDNARQQASDEQMAGIALPASDDMAIAWIMYASSDYGVSYSVGDVYDPTGCTTGVKAENVQITGEGTYTVSLDFSECGLAKGAAFSALGISNGEAFFPGYTYTIDEILINGEAVEMAGKGYTCSDDGKCTRVNLYNAWVKNIPDEARTADGDLTDCSAQIMTLTDNKRIMTISVTFTVKAPD